LQNPHGNCFMTILSTIMKCRFSLVLDVHIRIWSFKTWDKRSFITLFWSFEKSLRQPLKHIVFGYPCHYKNILFLSVGTKI
jgi:hypothetical protein